MTRYVPSRHYWWAGILALAMAAISGWVAWQWTPAWIALVLFGLSSLAVLFLASRPPIETTDLHLMIGRRRLAWAAIRKLDRTGWISPLVVRVTLSDRSGFWLIYPGDLETSNMLLGQMRRLAREALIDGIPYRQFWGELTGTPAAQEQPPQKQAAASPRAPLLRAEDEAEVERLFQRLKTVGHLDPKNYDDK